MTDTSAAATPPDVAGDVQTEPADDARSVAGSEKSTSSVRSGIPKFSGIKPPSVSKPPAAAASKIGRPCANVQTKPAIPATPTKSSSYDYERKEDTRRYKLTDVQETEEYEEDFFGNRLHTLPPRRNAYYSNKNPYYDFCERLDFFGNPMISYPPKFPRFRYYSKFEDIFSEFFWTTPRRASYSTSSYKKDDTYKESESFGSSSLYNYSPRRRSSLGSTGTTSSMDALWELHPRRLSEAGLSRHSDSSAILTEDTDSFIIGQRVWVGGTKSGQIAYIGETQFAPGEWAGIVLDQPIGKNDGSVGGVRYFQCEPKKGVFSRLTRLTRYPLDIGAGDSFACTSPSPTNGNRKSPISPTTSTRSALSISNTSLASTQVDFRVGDRVIIKSGQGSKIGTLRYMGFTSFANGEWCGVELDEPRGKNDGAVEGKRYFDCRPNFGLFAPVNKVSKSPSNRKPGGNCVVHPNAAMRRGGSKESLVSMTSSLASASTAAARRVRLGVTSLTPKKTPPKPTSTPLPSRTALQDVLKEKQQHIEQLLKERDLERAEITRAASQADEAEQKFATLRQEFEQYRNECEIKLKDYIIAIEKLKAEYNEALVQLDDEKRKNEDLQFKFEEAAITKGDIEVTNEANVSRIQELQTELEQKQALCEVDNARLSQMQEELAHSREENESLKVSLEHANEKRISLEYDESKSIELVQSLQSQLEDANNTLKQHQEASHKQIEALSLQVTKQTSDFEVATFKYQTEIEEARAKYSIDVTAKTQEVEALKVELIDTNERLERVCKDLEKQKYDAVGVESNLKKEAERVKMELSSKIVEAENFIENINKKEAEIDGLTQANSKLKLDFANLQKQFESDVLSLKSNEENLVRQLDELKSILNAKGGELELVRKAQEELEKQRALLSESQEGSNKKLTETQTELQKVTAQLQSKTGELDMAISSIKKLDEAVNTKQDENNKITAKCKELEDKLEHELNTLEESKSVIGKLELEAGDYQRKFQQNESKFAELTQQKQKLEADIQQLYGSSGEDSAKLEALNLSLRQKEAEVASLKDECSIKEHLLQQMEIALQNSSQKSEREITDLKQKLENLEKEQVEAKNKAESLIGDKDKCNEDLLQQLNTVKIQIQEKEVALKKALDDLEISTRNSSGEISKVTADYQSKIELLTKEICDHKENYTKATQELNEVRNALVAHGEENVSKCNKLQEEYENSLKTVNAEIARRDEAIQKLQLQVAQFGEDSATKNSTVEEKIQEIATLKGEFEKAVCVVEELKVERQKFAEEISKKQSETEAGYNGKIQELQGEIELGRGKIQELLSQLELSKNDVNSNLVNMEGKEQEISKLVSDLQTAQSSVENLAKEKTKLEDLNKQNAEVNKKQCEELSKQIAGLQENMAKAEGAFKNSEVERGIYQDVFKMLTLNEAQKSKLLKNLQGKELQGLVKNIKVEQDEAKLQVLELQEITNKTNAALEGAKQQLQMQQTEILNLQNEIIKAKQEKTAIPEEVTAITDASIINNNKVSNDYKQLLEEKMFAESQVQFLNSIIVDMQKKNEEQKARIEILESGYSPAAADELKLMGFMEKKTPPRLYCDICEEFDLHETEDCPLQAAEDLPAPPREDNGKKEKAPPRPYCEICEMFGHATEDCQDDQTF